MGDNLEDATLTIRIIRSFEYRNHRNLVLHHVDLSKTKLPDLIEMIRTQMTTVTSLRPIIATENYYDTLKLYAQPHGAKCNNPIINVGGDDFLILKDTVRPLCELGVGHETELSFFNSDDYKAYKLNPVTKW